LKGREQIFKGRTDIETRSRYLKQEQTLKRGAGTLCLDCKEGWK
jgi:hypothetical protein